MNYLSKQELEQRLHSELGINLQLHNYCETTLFTEQEYHSIKQALIVLAKIYLHSTKKVS